MVNGTGKYFHYPHHSFDLTNENPTRLLSISDYEPFSIVERLIPYLGGSAPIVMYSPYIQVGIPLFILQNNLC